MCPREGEREPGAYKKAHTGRGTEQRMKTAPGREAGRRMNMARGAPCGITRASDPATVDADGLAGEVEGCFGKKKDELGDFFGAAEAAHRDLFR